MTKSLVPKLAELIGRVQELVMFPWRATPGESKFGICMLRPNKLPRLYIGCTFFSRMIWDLYDFHVAHLLVLTSVSFCIFFFSLHISADTFTVCSNLILSFLPTPSQQRGEQGLPVRTVRPPPPPSGGGTLTETPSAMPVGCTTNSTILTDP